MSSEKSKTYTNGEVTIKWTPKLCIHSGACVRGLPNVFKPKERPWINMEAAESEELIETVKKCPSGALSIIKNDAKDNSETLNKVTKVEMKLNGPLLVHGEIEITNLGGEVDTRSNLTAFCRCGASSNKPFCDGQHTKTGFKG